MSFTLFLDCVIASGIVMHAPAGHRNRMSVRDLYLEFTEKKMLF